MEIKNFLIGLAVGIIICSLVFLSARRELFRQAHFVGIIETKLSDTVNEKDKEHYQQWLDNLEDRGYLWGR